MTVVLVVDDVPTMAGQYAYDLERLAGYEVLTAGDPWIFWPAPSSTV